MADTQSQIQQMSQFILAEAKDKAEEITTKALQEFSVEKMKIVNQMKDKTRGDYERKTKAIETQMAIARSTAVNQSRLEKIKTRQEVLKKIKDDTEKQLVDKLRSEAQSKPFITKLIVQGLLMLLEENVQVRCRAVDDKMVQSCLEDAAAQYSQVVQKETGASRSASLTLDKQNKLPPAPTEGAHGATCIGGVVLACQNGSITIDNTIDSRLNLVMEQAKPTIRQLLFSGR
jgi:V-type H+-transporting ATPase subunit E